MGLADYQIIPAQSPQHIEHVRALFNAYADELGYDLSFQNFDRELADLPGQYAPPRGCLLLARHGEEIIACVGLRSLSDDTCEMKRMYVRPTLRGRGIGRAMAKAIIEQAAELGYKHMRLDTIRTMKSAIALYLSLGFYPIEPYYFNPIEGTMYMELTLR